MSIPVRGDGFGLSRWTLNGDASRSELWVRVGGGEDGFS